MIAEAQLGLQCAGLRLLDSGHHVQNVLGFPRLGFDAQRRLEIPQGRQILLGLAQFSSIVKLVLLHLELPSHHVVPGFAVALKLDTADIGFLVLGDIVIDVDEARGIIDADIGPHLNESVSLLLVRFPQSK